MAMGAPGNLRKLLNANGKKKPKRQRKRKRKVNPTRMPPGVRY